MLKQLYDHIGELVIAYHNTRRHQELERLEMSSLYPLVPEGGGAPYWPDGHRPGVYLLFDQSKETILYVGQSNKLNRRLRPKLRELFYKTFDGSNWGAEFYKWGIKPAFIAVVPVTDKHEALALESYLIYELDPPENTIGRPTEDEKFFRRLKLHAAHPTGDWIEIINGRLHSLRRGPSSIAASSDNGAVGD